MGLPDFMIIGAAKSGTTSLHEYLKLHPQLSFPKHKEPNFYALADQAIPALGPAKPEVLRALLYSHSVLDRKQYEGLFADTEDQLDGEASVRYLYFPNAPKRIHADVPNVRLIAILREPVARMYSHYCMNRQLQLEPLDFSDAVAAEAERRESGWGWDWHYTEVGRYATQLKRYFDLFGAEQILVLLYEDLVERPQWVIEEICRHLDVDDTYKPDMSVRSKPASRPRNLWLDRQLHWPNRLGRSLVAMSPSSVYTPVLERISSWNSVPVPPLPDSERTELGKRFSQDNADLADLLGRAIPWN